MKIKNNQGFTLIEILITLTIIGLLSTLVTIAVRTAREKARITKAEHEIDQIFKAVSMISNDTYEWPGHQMIDVVNAGTPNNEICGEDINANNCLKGLDDSSSGIMNNDGTYQTWEGPYMDKMPLDPWGREYFFDTDYQVDINNNPCGCGGGGCVDTVVVGSYGPDQAGVPNGGNPGAYGCDDIIRIVER